MKEPDVLKIYGIPNCDTCRKARKWLEANSVDYVFHDLRADGLDKKTLERWMHTADWTRLLNTRSTTWRNIPDSEKQDLDPDRAADLMLSNPTLVKRPVAELAQVFEIGFSAEQYQRFRG